ncbi:hypothetical protein SLEP1_g33842 [Rubroshorea leprosula]|uniref:2-(3-amino-3-carboxypropyl)histidine synthase subunit 1 n=1 Tax=Rubroshorea leprosula TaxID=152421 RepID=A0AAV5KHY0_9ROSI|nr:hypothetical protein SLEP1_g33842 [Rubroshorea leprosula]
MIDHTKLLLAGEALGCTAPKITSIVNGCQSVLVFVEGGSFHIEVIMIANPGIRAFGYDPYLGRLFLEEYDNRGMKGNRRKAMAKTKGAASWGIVLGKLGRQGNPRFWRDWRGNEDEKSREEEEDLVGDHPMDYYAQDGGDWNSSYAKNKKLAHPLWRNTAPSMSNGDALTCAHLDLLRHHNQATTCHVASSQVASPGLALGALAALGCCISYALWLIIQAKMNERKGLEPMEVRIEHQASHRSLCRNSCLWIDVYVDLMVCANGRPTLCFGL